MITPSELLQRISATVRADVGPAVVDEYPRTQAFMAAVILERVSREVALAPGHSEAERADVIGLLAVIEPLLANAPGPVGAGLAEVREQPSMATLAVLVEALYRWGADEAPVEAALTLIRPVLRRDIDRRMEIAR